MTDSTDEQPQPWRWVYKIKFTLHN